MQAKQLTPEDIEKAFDIADKFKPALVTAIKNFTQAARVEGNTPLELLVIGVSFELCITAARNIGAVYTDLKLGAETGDWHVADKELYFKGISLLQDLLRKAAEEHIVVASNTHAAANPTRH